MARTLASAAINAPRDSHYVLNPVSGLYERSLLLEGTRKNDVKNNTAVGAGAGVLPTGWSNNVIAGVTFTVVGTVTDPSLPGVTGVRIKYDNTLGTTQNPSFQCGAAGTGATPYTPSTNRAVSSYFALVANTGVVQANLGAYSWNAAGGFVATLTGGTIFTPTIGPLARVTGVVSTSNAAAVFEMLRWSFSVVAGGSITVDVYGPQDELGSFASSLILTSTVAITRGADTHVRSLGGLTPQALTRYTRFINLGTLDASSANLRVWQMGGSNANSLRLIGNGVAGSLVMLHEDAVAVNVNSTATCGAVSGDQVETLAQWYGDGAVQLTAVRNAGTPAVGAKSAAKVPFVAFGADLDALGATSAGAAGGFMAVLNDEIQLGIKTLADMRAIAAA